MVLKTPIVSVGRRDAEIRLTINFTFKLKGHWTKTACWKKSVKKKSEKKKRREKKVNL